MAILKSGTQKIRRIVQLFFFAVVLLIVIADVLKEKGISLPVGKDLHLVCPFGAVANIGSLIMGRGFVNNTGLENLPSLFAILVVALIGGSLFCGWLCPLGAVQDWFGMLGKRLFPKRFNRLLPPKLDKILGFLRYAVLAWVLIFTAISMRLVFKSVDPYYALFHAWTGRAAIGSIVVLGVILAGSLVIHRPWCRWFCPMGAVLGLIQKLSPVTIRKRKSCVSCAACVKACPMGIDVIKKDAVRDDRCNRCLECVSTAEKRNCLTYGFKRVRRASPAKDGKWIPALKVVSLILVFGGILGTGTALIRFVEGGTAPRVNTEDSAESPTNPAQSIITPGEISGTMTLEDLAAAFDFSTEEILLFLGLPENYSLAVKIRDLELTHEEKTLSWVRRRFEQFVGE